MTTSEARILIVEDEAITALDIQGRLAGLGYRSSEIAGSGEEAVDKAGEMRPDLVLMDIMLPGKIDGVEAAERIRAAHDIPIVYVTAYADDDTLRRAKVTEPYGYLVKSFRDTDLRIAVEIALYKHETEKKLRHVGELERLNKELEAFSYSVSHDLRAPLRAIDGFSQVILKDYADKLDARGVDYLTRIRNATQLMGQLIDGLLKLSRITRAEVRVLPVDLSAMARTTAETLRSGQPERAVTLLIADGLAAQGDPALLQVVLENLMGNAWKFTSKHPTATIEFGVMPPDGTYFVRDDGAGFDMAYADKLFAPFERLHTRKQFEGTGIGLATVQRIVHRHGGSVWAEGAVEKGATFYFTLGERGGDHGPEIHPAGGGQP